MLGREQEQQFLTLVVDRDDVYFSDDITHGVQVVDGLVPVEHGRELEQHPFALVKQFLFYLQDIGCAVADGVGAGSFCVAACRVYIYKVGRWHLVQIVRRIGTDHFCVFQSQQCKVVSRCFAEVGLLLHIGGCRCGRTAAHRTLSRRHRLCQESEVNTQAAREVYYFFRGCGGARVRGYENQRSAPTGKANTVMRFIAFLVPPYLRTPAPRNNTSLVPRCLFRRALLHRQVGRIDDTLDGGPRRNLLPGRLPPGYLLQGERHVHIGIALALQGQQPHIVLAVFSDKLFYIHSSC